MQGGRRLYLMGATLLLAQPAGAMWRQAASSTTVTLAPARVMACINAAPGAPPPTSASRACPPSARSSTTCCPSTCTCSHCSVQAWRHQGVRCLQSSARSTPTRRQATHPATNAPSCDCEGGSLPGRPHAPGVGPGGWASWRGACAAAVTALCRGRLHTSQRGPRGQGEGGGAAAVRGARARALHARRPPSTTPPCPSPLPTPPINPWRAEGGREAQRGRHSRGEGPAGEPSTPLTHLSGPPGWRTAQAGWRWARGGGGCAACAAATCVWA